MSSGYKNVIFVINLLLYNGIGVNEDSFNIHFTSVALTNSPHLFMLGHRVFFFFVKSELQ